MNQKQKLKEPAIEVSIIIISYNVQKYLIQCIESILHHTNTKFKYEIIVIDNHSYDDTEKGEISLGQISSIREEIIL